MQKIFGLAILLSLLAFEGCSQPTTNQITADEIKAHINYLAGDSCAGRFPGTRGSQLAQDYINRAFRLYKLQPLAENGRQSFNVVTSCTTGDKNFLAINNDTLKLETDYIPFSFSKNITASGDVVFAGYGIHLTNDSIKHNDYQDIDVHNKWVMILRFDPDPQNMHSPYSLVSSDRSKATFAHDAGAAGVLVVNGISTEKMDKLPKLRYDQNMASVGIPYIGITRETANKILAKSGKTIEQLEEQLLKTKQTKAFDAECTVSANSDIRMETKKANNIVFQIEAANGTDSNIIIGAHFDHLGMGGAGTGSRRPDTTAIHYGADDNASGIAGIIELAGYFQQHRGKLRHNLVFVAFDAEEMGTLGSKAFVEKAPVDLKKTVAMINFDMIGRMKDDSSGIAIGGTGTATVFDSLIAIHKTSFAIHSNPDGYGPSDHAPFYSSNIPVLFFSTGAHEDYHTPNDVSTLINPLAEQKILEYAAKLIQEIDQLSTPLTFVSTGTPQNSTKYGKLKVTLGIIPDMIGVQKDGLGVDGVRKDGPAEKGGIKKGDKIIAINSKGVGNIHEYMLRLSSLEPGETAIVEVVRNEKHIVLLIQL